MKRTVSAALVLILALAFLLPGFLQAADPQTAPAKSSAKAKVPPKPVTIHPAFATLRDKTAVIVFLAWLWLIVCVLVWALRLKIREADRVYHAKFYAHGDRPERTGPRPSAGSGIPAGPGAH